MNLTIDVGTTNTKISLWKTSSNTSEKPIDQKKFKTPKEKRGIYDNFNAEKLFDEILNAIWLFNVSDRAKITSISIASVGESGVLIDESGRQASEMIAWYDNRSQDIINKLSYDDKKKIYEITGLPINPHYSASKICWLLEKKVVSRKLKYTWLCIPDYIAYRFTGLMRTEYSIASRTMLLDIKEKKWSKKVISILNISNIKLPPIINAGEKVGKLKEILSNALGISNEAYITIAGHDHMVGSFFSEQKEGELLDSTGTTEALLLLTDKFNIRDNDQKNGIAYGVYVDSKYYTVFTALPAAGSVIGWFMSIFNLSNEKFTALMNEVYDDYQLGKISNKSLNFVIPHFNGSGSPQKSSYTKGLWYGLTNKTTLKDMIFGLFLGLTFELKNALEVLNKGNHVEKIKLIGPAIKDPLWIQLRADLLNVKIYAMEAPEAVSRGANVIIKNKYIGNVKECAKGNEYVPENKDIVNVLLKLYYRKYKEIYINKTKIENDLL